METTTEVSPPPVSAAWRVSLFLAFAAALTSSWTGVNVAGIKLTDYLLVAGAAFVLVAAIGDGRRLPIYAWAVLPPLSLLVIALIGSVVRGDPLSARQEVTLHLVGVATVFSESAGAIPLIGRMTLALTLVTTIVAGLSANMQDGKIFVERLMRVWAVGAAVSATYSVVEHVAGISLLGNSSFLTHLAADSRASGLANHPNSLGQTLVTALPMLIYMVGASRGWVKLIVALSLPITMYAIFLSGARAALIFGAFFAAVTFAYLVISGRRISLWVLPVTIVVAPLALVVLPSILDATRFFDRLGQMSTAMRLTNLQRGMDLFNSNPLFGSGVGSWTYEMVPLILLTSGGLLYFAIFYGSLIYPLVKRPRSSGGTLIPVLVISAVSVFVYGLLGNGIFERYLYWPFAALFALGLAHHAAAESSPTTGARDDLKRRPGGATTRTGAVRLG